LYFLGAKQEILSNDWSCFCLIYQAIHGEEDKQLMPNPANEQNMIENFDNIFNEE
jgi:hypothetical protein